MPSDEMNPKHAPSTPNMEAPQDPTVRAQRAAARRTDDGEAFLPDPTRGARVNANDAEFFGEEFLASATTGEPQHMDAADEVVDEEEGGPVHALAPAAAAAAESEARSARSLEAEDRTTVTATPRARARGGRSLPR